MGKKYHYDYKLSYKERGRSFTWHEVGDNFQDAKARFLLNSPMATNIKMLKRRKIN